MMTTPLTELPNVRAFDGNVLTGLRTVAIVDGQIPTGFVESAINQVVSKRMVKETTDGVEPA